MAYTLPLHEMSVEEKLRMMETLWEDLTRSAPNLPPPPWHGEVLAERAAAGTDEEPVSDWKDAREKIELKIR